MIMSSIIRISKVVLCMQKTPLSTPLLNNSIRHPQLGGQVLLPAAPPRPRLLASMKLPSYAVLQLRCMLHVLREPIVVASCKNETS